MSVVFVLLCGPNLEAFFLHAKKRGSVFNSFLSFQTREFFGQPKIDDVLWDIVLGCDALTQN